LPDLFAISSDISLSRPALDQSPLDAALTAFKKEYLPLSCSFNPTSATGVSSGFSSDMLLRRIPLNCSRECPSAIETSAKSRLLCFVANASISFASLAT